MGPFFRRFARDLEESGNTVYKINFNAGDSFFFNTKNSKNYTDTIEDWPKYLEQKLKKWEINAVYLFGNERSYHKKAHEIAREHSIDVFVFEEGYLRPHYITLEKDGVNGHSSIPNNPEAYNNIKETKKEKPTPVPYSFLHTAYFAILYYLTAWRGRDRFPHYIHHRAFNPYNETAIWLRAGYRKLYYKIAEHGILKKLITKHSKQYFLVPLQVHNDAQIKTWSSAPSVAAFIRRVISSFSKHAPKGHLLVIKHHPLDRGYTDYTNIIKKLARKFDCEKRVIYIHDLALPLLLDHAKGTVLLNSTVGISSILHGTPVKTSGHAVYNIEGLTFQGRINEFWKNPGKVDKKLNRRFRNYLIDTNQINGNFYRKISSFKNHCGIDYKHLNKLTCAPYSTTHSTTKKSEINSPQSHVPATSQ